MNTATENATRTRSVIINSRAAHSPIATPGNRERPPLIGGRRSASLAGPLTERERGLLQLLHESFVVMTTFPSADRP
jgi:hypothetical protein